MRYLLCIGAEMVAKCGDAPACGVGCVPNLRGVASGRQNPRGFWRVRQEWWFWGILLNQSPGQVNGRPRGGFPARGRARVLPADSRRAFPGISDGRPKTKEESPQGCCSRMKKHPSGVYL